MRYRTTQPHPGIHRVARETVEWAAAHSLVRGEDERQRAAQIRVGELAALAYPREPEPVVRLGADLILWLFLFDDAVGEASEHMSASKHEGIMQTYTHVLYRRDLPTTAGPFHRALLDLLDRAAELGATHDWFERFAVDMSDYFLGCVAESRYRHGHEPNLFEYRELRRATVGTSQVFAIMELGCGGVVPPDEVRRSEVVEAREIAALLTAWVNDIYSFPKEFAAGDPLNLVATIANSHGLSTPEEALETAAAIYNLDLEMFEHLCSEIGESPCSPELEAYLDRLLDWIHGNRVWTQMCGRYF